MYPVVHSQLSKTNQPHSSTYDCRIFVEELVETKGNNLYKHIPQTKTLCTLVLSATQGAGTSKAKRIIDRHLTGMDSTSIGYGLRINPKNIRLAPKEENRPALARISQSI